MAGTRKGKHREDSEPEYKRAPWAARGKYNPEPITPYVGMPRNAAGRSVLMATFHPLRDIWWTVLLGEGSKYWFAVFTDTVCSEVVEFTEPGQPADRVMERMRQGEKDMEAYCARRKIERRQA
jgi:hypothetical protein